MKKKNESITYNVDLHVHIFDKEHFEDKQKDRLNDLLSPTMKHQCYKSDKINWLTLLCGLSNELSSSISSSCNNLTDTEDTGVGIFIP